MTRSQDRRRRATAAAMPFGGVLPREVLARLGVDSHVVQRETAAERWSMHGGRTVALHTGPLNDEATRWRAVWEVGCGATLDGVSALQAAGMRGFSGETVHVSVSEAARPRWPEGVVVHRVRRVDGESVASGVPRARPAVAALRAAAWATTDRQAALLLVLPVQQRIVTSGALRTAAQRISSRARRRLVRQLVADITAGAHSLGELDFAAACRRRGLPAPDRQVVVETDRGRVYLDLRWSAVGLVVEIDGAGHGWGLAPVRDSLRQNEIAIGGNVVLRIDLVGWRLDPEAYLDQVARHTRC